MLKTLSLLFHLINVLTLIGVNGREYETEDSIIIDVVPLRKTREARQNNAISLASWGNSLYTEGSSCFTAKYELGSCVSYKTCYPYFKNELPELSAWDSWVYGQLDSCTYFDEEGRQAFGICCTSPVSVASGEPASGNHKYDISNWPPQIPTHPPDHAAPTHPPVSGSWPSNVSPLQSTTLRPTYATTTKKPIYQWPPPLPTHPPQSAITTSTEAFFQGDSTAYCGMKNGNQDQERIVGGQNAVPNEWPWVVALFNRGRQFCGGSLLNSVHILTAAHCIAQMSSYDVQGLTVRLGDHNIRVHNEVQHIERRVKRVVRHRGFDFRTLYNDIAILTMDTPVQYTRTVRPICLPPQNSRQYHGMVGTVIGWGSLRENGPQPAILQKVSIPIWSNAQCRGKYGAHAPGGILDSMLCAGQDSRDSCSGDSGGPLMVNEGHWVQIGVVSWGIGCGKGQYPGVYTRITSFLPWIFKNIQQS